jgi:hypothetical protein
MSIAFAAEFIPVGDAALLAKAFGVSVPFEKCREADCFPYRIRVYEDVDLASGLNAEKPVFSLLKAR